MVILNKKNLPPLLIFAFFLVLGLGIIGDTSAVTKPIGETATITVTCFDADDNLSQCNVTSPCSESCSISGRYGSCSCDYTCTTEGTYNACGQAWDTLGMTDRKCLDTVICTNPPNNTPSQLSDYWNNCGYKGKSLPVLSWSGDTQAGYEIQIDDNASLPNDPPGQGEWREVSAIPSNSYTPAHRAEEWANWMEWDKQYWWVVRVKDNQGNWSGWSDVKKMDEKSPIHPYPWPDFTWDPQEPTQGEVVIFDPDLSETFGGASIAGYLWTVTQGDGAFVDGTNQLSHYPHIIFSASNNAMSLGITDTDGYSCSKEKPVTAQLSLPEYKEVPPIIWLKKIFTPIVGFFDGFFKFSDA